MGSFHIHICAPGQSETVIARRLPPIPELEVKPVSVRVLASENGGFGTPVCVWICNETCGLAESLVGAGDESRIIWLGQGVTAAQALLLGRARVTSVYDLDTDGNMFVNRILKEYSDWKSNRSSPDEPQKNLGDVIIGRSSRVETLRKTIIQVAGKDKLMVLVRGETGTGKGLAARMIHDMGGDTSRPFIEINCTAIPDTLVEAELFGHDKGAFTDAHRNRRGIFEMAHGGTLFLDEIGYLKSETQAKLLKVLEDRRFRRVGGETDIQVECRIITGTSVNLEKAVKDGVFRQDLYYRLNVFPIHVPALRDRREDIMILAEYFREFFCREHAVETGGFTEKARLYLTGYAWPGNIRELKHVMERAVILCDGTDITLESVRRLDDETGVTPDDAGDVIRIAIPELGKSLDTIQKEVIRSVLEMTGGNRSEAARLLNISRSRLLRHIGTD